MNSLREFFRSTFEVPYQLGRMCASLASVLAFTMLVSSSKTSADSWFLTAMPFFTALLLVAFISVFLAFIVLDGDQAYLTLKFMVFPLVSLVLISWTDWNLVGEYVLMLGLSVVAAAAGIIDRARLRRNAGGAPSPVIPRRRVNADAAREGVRVEHGQPDDLVAEEGNGAPTFNYPSVMSEVTYANVSGMEATKQRLKEAALEVIRGSQTPASPRNGILLHGDPGNGKTFLVEALAGELYMGLIKVSFGDVVSRFVGQTPEQVVQVFRDAKAQAPCVLFIDEIDSLIRDRSLAVSDNEETNRITNTLLTEIVDLRKHKVLLIAATNFLDKLDAAAIREGRFDFKIEIPAPDATAREALIRRAVARYPSVSIEDAAVTQAVKRWDGFSAARINAVSDEACRTAFKGPKKLIGFRALEKALRVTQGRAGRLPPDTPLLSELTLPPSLAREIKGVCYRMKNIEETEEHGGTIPGGLLFLGPPGTGKTVTARALAKTAGWAFLDVTGSELLANPDRVDAIARQARDIRPCIIFLDEADDVLADRRSNPYSARVTNRLLTAIDGAGGKIHDVVWVAATNNPDLIDEAALRGGRFTVKVKFDLPDEATRAVFIGKWMRSSKASFDEALTPSRVAGELPSLSIANIKAVMQQAVDMAVDRKMLDHGSGIVTLDDVRGAHAIITGISM